MGPIGLIFQSRKGIAAFVSVLFGLVAVTGLTVSATLGKISWSDYFSHVQVVTGTVTVALVAFILGTAHEDAAAKSAQGKAASSDGNGSASATANVVVAPAASGEGTPS